MEQQILVQAAMKNLRPTIPAGFPIPTLISDVWAKDPAARPNCDQLLEKFASARSEYNANSAAWDALVVPFARSPAEKKSSTDNTSKK